MATRRNDSFGYKRGAKGIDDDKDEGFQNKGRDEAAEKAQFGQSWWNLDGTKDITGK